MNTFETDFANRNFALSMTKELDYGYNNEIKSHVDDRILNFCKEAETNYINNINQVKEIQRMRKVDDKIKEEKLKIYKENENFLKQTKKSVELRKMDQEEAFNNFNFSQANGKGFSDKRASSTRRSMESNEFNNALHYNQSNGMKKPAVVQQNNFVENKFHQNTNRMSDMYKSDQFDNNWNSNRQKNIYNNNQFDKNASMQQNKEIMSKRASSELRNSNQFKSSNGNINSLIKSSSSFHKKPGHQCIACDLKKKIEYKPDENNEHVKFKYNFNINNVILEAKMNMKKLNFRKAYEILKLPIVQGVIHSDIFYLYSESCRIIKYYEESEKYLLEALQFDQHSPYVFYTGGLLYQEMKEYRKSVSLFKHFLEVLENADTHYQIAKSYTGLKKYLKASLHITNAININPNSAEYYYFRSKVYQILGFDELAKDDLTIIRQLQRSG